MREYPIEADVDPAFAVLEGMDAAQLRQQAVRQTLESLARARDSDPDKEALRRTLAEWPRRYLEQVLEYLLEKKGIIARYMVPPLRRAVARPNPQRLARDAANDQRSRVPRSAR